MMIFRFHWLAVSCCRSPDTCSDPPSPSSLRQGLVIPSRPTPDDKDSSVIPNNIVIRDPEIVNDDDGEDDGMEGEDTDMDNFQFLSGGLMSKKSVEVSEVRADAEAAMKEFESVVGIGAT